MNGRAPIAKRIGAALLAAMLWSGVGLGSAQAQDANTLRAQHAALRDRLASNQFQRPLVLESVQNSNDLKGEVYAVIDQPYSVVAAALRDADHWCELLMLHLNVKHCSTAGKAPGEMLTLSVGRKFDQPLADAYRVEFNYSVVASGTDYLRVQMMAENGPLSTHDYRLALEAVSIDSRRSFLHMSYSYAYGMAARLAMQVYLATVGHDKVGFSIVGTGAEGKPEFIQGVRGVVERNTMRYYLAIEAYLGAISSLPAEQSERRLRDWFSAVERYPVQLHEMERTEYLDMKHRELQRQRANAKAESAK